MLKPPPPLLLHMQTVDLNFDEVEQHVVSLEVLLQTLVRGDSSKCRFLHLHNLPVMLLPWILTWNTSTGTHTHTTNTPHTHHKHTTHMHTHAHRHTHTNTHTCMHTASSSYFSPLQGSPDSCWDVKIQVSIHTQKTHIRILHRARILHRLEMLHDFEAQDRAELSLGAAGQTVTPLYAHDRIGCWEWWLVGSDQWHQRTDT